MPTLVFGALKRLHFSKRAIKGDFKTCAFTTLFFAAFIVMSFMLWNISTKVGKSVSSHLSTAVAQREKKSKQFVFNKYFSLVLGVLKSKISKKSFELLLRKLDFKLFHYKARVQPVSKITTIATRNRC